MYAEVGLLKGWRTEDGKGLLIWAAGDGMGLSTAGGIFLKYGRKETYVGMEALSFSPTQHL